MGVMVNFLGRLLGLQDARDATVASPWADRAHIETATWAGLLDLPADALPVTRAQAMSVAAVARGRHLLTGTIARLPLLAMRGDDTLADQPTIIGQPEVGRPRSQTLTWITDALIFYGRAWLIATERDAPTEGGRPRRVTWVPEWLATVDQLGQLTAVDGVGPVAPSDVLRVDGPHEGLLNFASPRIRSAIRLDQAALRAASNPVPSVELHQTSGTPLDRDAARQLVADYIAARQSSDVSYTNPVIETKTHGASPENLLIDGRKAAALDLARAMGLPAWAVDAPVEGASMTYTNVPARSRELVDYALAPYMTAIADRLSMDDVLPRGTWCRFDTDPLLIEPFGDRVTAYKTALEAGLYTTEELRARDRGRPLES